VNGSDDQYDSRSNRVLHIDAKGNETRFVYDGHDRVVSQTAVGPPGLTSLFELDALDRQVKVTDPRGIAAKTVFDLAGRRVTLVEDFATSVPCFRCES